MKSRFFGLIAAPILVVPRGNLVLKRIFDLFLSAALLLLLAPVFIAIALAIRATSRGPALFRQSRTGRHLHPFSILKFRTMAADARGPAFTLCEDPRVTPLGRWLRRTKLDELPQLWNILRGQMSFVGPRPILPELTHGDPEAYRRLYRVRPGLTDPASIKYAEEGQLLQRVKDPELYFHQTIARDKLRLALDYQHNATLASDLRILAQTVQIFHRSVLADIPRPNWPRPAAQRTLPEQP